MEKMLPGLQEVEERFGPVQALSLREALGDDRKLEFIDGRPWVDGIFKEAVVVPEWTFEVEIPGPGGGVFPAEVEYTRLTPYAKFLIFMDLEVEYLGDQTPHEASLEKNFHKSRVGPKYADKPYLNVVMPEEYWFERDGRLIQKFVGDAATRWGAEKHNYPDTWRERLIVSANVPDFRLNVGVWRESGEEALSLEEIYRVVQKGNLIKSKQSRFGGLVWFEDFGGFVTFPVGEIFPRVTFKENLNSLF